MSAVCNTSVPEGYGIFLISCRGTSPAISPHSFNRPFQCSSKSNTGAVVSLLFWVIMTQDHYVVSQTLKQRNGIFERTWKKVLKRTEKQPMNESKESNRASCRAPEQRGHFQRVGSLSGHRLCFFLFLSFFILFMLVSSVWREPPQAPYRLHHLLGLHWAVEDGSLIVLELQEFKLVCPCAHSVTGSPFSPEALPAE